jgi:hypothetical protein
MASRSKPLGITLVALYSALSALMLIPAGCTITLLGQVPGIGGFASIFGYFSSLLGLLSCAVVYGLWTLQEWGRSLAYWFYIVSIPLGVIAIFPPLAGQKATAGNAVFQLVSIAIDLIVVAYLSKQQIKDLFSGSNVSTFSTVANRREPF